MKKYVCERCKEKDNLSHYEPLVRVRIDGKVQEIKKRVIHCNRCGYTTK